jgi:hypothetical protein
MAKKPAATTAHADDIPPAMDYAQHEATWHGVTEMVKWSIIALAVICVALYCFIEAHQPILGTLLLLALPVGAVALVVMRARSTD